MRHFSSGRDELHAHRTLFSTSRCVDFINSQIRKSPISGPTLLCLRMQQKDFGQVSGCCTDRGIGFQRHSRRRRGMTEVVLCPPHGPCDMTGVMPSPPQTRCHPHHRTTVAGYEGHVTSPPPEIMSISVSPPLRITLVGMNYTVSVF